MPIAAGTKLGRYEIRSKLGAGGMGEVYLAEDTLLDRSVAIKFLPAELTADDQAKKRLIREAKAAAKLDHPNICSIYEVGEEDGRIFIVMQYVEGETLASKIQRKPLELKEALDIGAQVADALAEPHSRGIIHRDIKPANIMITARGQVKVTDFGLAKRIKEQAVLESGAKTESLLTEPGVIMGTPAYMSPEQVRGESLGASSDIFSFGAVLYEMVSGHKPFEAESVAATISAILTREPAPLARYSREVPDELERIVSKALRKDREERYQIIKELLLDLRALKQHLEIEAELERSKAPENDTAATIRLSGAQAAPVSARRAITQAAEGTVQPATARIDQLTGAMRRHRRVALVGSLAFVLTTASLAYFLYFAPTGKAIDSIAVLPLNNLTNDPTQDYFVEGMHEALITELSKISALKVISRTSTMHYKQTDKRMDQIARELGVNGLIEGSVSREADQVRITVELIHGPTDKHLWAESYQRELRSILALQSDVARAVANEIQVQVTSQERSRLASARPVNPEAYQLYLKGRYFWYKRSEEGLRKALEYFNQAIEKDPTYCLAYAGVAYTYETMGHELYGVLRPGDAYPKAKAAALKALEIDENLGEAHAVLAYSKFRYDWDFVGAEQEYKRALELNPSFAVGHIWYSHYLLPMGRVQESFGESLRAIDLDPLSAVINMHLGWHYLYAGQYDQATAQLRKTLELDPNFAVAHLFLGQAYEQQGRLEEAIAEFQQAVSVSGGLPIHIAALGHAYGMSGRRAEAEGILNELKALSQRRHVSSYEIAVVHGGLGEKEQALALLEESYRQRDSSWLVDVNADPRFVQLRSDPRFQDLVRRIGLAR